MVQNTASVKVEKALIDDATELVGNDPHYPYLSSFANTAFRLLLQKEQNNKWRKSKK